MEDLVGRCGANNRSDIIRVTNVRLAIIHSWLVELRGLAEETTVSFAFEGFQKAHKVGADKARSAGDEDATHFVVFQTDRVARATQRAKDTAPEISLDTS